jgi:hypothetical protein
MKRLPAYLSMGLCVTTLIGCDADPDLVDPPVAVASSAIAVNGALDHDWNGTGLREASDSAAMYTTAITEAGSGMTVALGWRHDFDFDRNDFVDVATITRYEPGGGRDPIWAWNAGTPRPADGFFNQEGTRPNGLVWSPEYNVNHILLEKYYALVDLKQADGWHSTVMKLDGYGKLDTAFQSGGVWTPTLPGYTDVELNRIARDAAGRIVVAGSAKSTGGIAYIVVARFDPANNRLDPAWGQNGWAIPGLGGLGTYVTGMSIGKGRNDVVLAVSGADQLVHLDATGHSVVSSNGLYLLRDVAVAADGRAYAVTDEGFVTAFKPNLQVDTAFATGGKLDVKSYPDGPGTNPHELATAIVYSPALDRIFVAGSVTRDHSATFNSSVVAVKPDGTFDRRWVPGSSKLLADFPSSYFDTAQALAITSDNKLLMGSTLSIRPTPDKPSGDRITGIARFLLATLRP